MSLPALSLPNPLEDFGDLLIETKVREVLPYAGGPRLLVVEDEPVDRMHIRRLLRKAGIPTTVDEAESVTSAREAITAADFDCVLLDYSLGDGGGSDVMFGYPKDMLIGRPVEDLVPERFRRKHSVYRTSYLSVRERRDMGRGRELFGLRYDQTEFPIEIGLTPIDGADDRRVVATINDITERKARDDLIRQKNTALTHLNEELTQFAYSASHDLKALLASIAGALRICQEDLRDGSADEVFTNLSRSQQMAERLAQRIEDMLSLARADQCEDNLEPVNVAAIVDDEWATVGGMVLDDDVELRTDYQHEEPILTVRVRFSAIIENLLSNAWKYRDPTKGRPVIAVETRSKDDMFILKVRDNGIGIPVDCHHKVFKLFQRFSDNDSPGSGLGLALVQKNARQLGGNVTFKSSPAGTVFTVSLPRRPGLTIEEAAE